VIIPIRNYREKSIGLRVNEFNNIFMKKIRLSTIFALAALIGSHLAIAQCNDKGITTNPDAPSNTERPAKRNTFFDWRSQYYQVNSTRISATQIESPFFQGYQNANVISLYTNKDMNAQDGWELIKYDLGFNEDGTKKNPAIDYAFLILYNRYLGKLRIFLAGDSPSPFNGATIQLRFVGSPDSEKYSSLISNSVKSFGLDQFEPNPGIVGVTSYLNGLGKWFYSDFQMTYDPCTCFYESLLQVEVKLINEAQISIDGSFTGTIASITSNSSGSVSDSGYSLKELVTAGTKATKSFKSIRDFTTEQEKALKIAGKPNIELKVDELFKRNQLNTFQEEIKKSNFLKAGLKVAPYVAGAVELVNFFTGGGLSGPSQVELTPMSINANLDLKGTLTASFRYRDLFFYTPGSKNAQIKNGNLYSYYNETLGIFNLLTTPKMYYSISDGEDGYYKVLNRKYQLISNIEYVLNPAAKFVDIEIMGNLIFRSSLTNAITMQTGFLPITALTQFSLESHVNRYCGFGCDVSLDNPEVKLLINLKRAEADAQNVLLVMTFPIQLVQAPIAYSFSSTSFNSASPPDVSLSGTYSNVVLSANNSIALTSGASLSFLNSGRSRGTVAALRTFSNQFSSFSNYLAPAPISRVNDFCSNGAYYTNPQRNARVAAASDESRQNLREKEIRTYPNPATNQVTFNYFLEEPTSVALGITDISGRSVAAIVNQEQEMGDYSLTYDTSSLPPGVYIVSFQTNKISKTEKLVVIK
jgi:hypothetical protein